MENRKRTLVTIGDSWTYGAYYIDGKRHRVNKTYGDVLCNLLEYDEHINLGFPATSLRYAQRTLYNFLCEREDDGDYFFIVGLTSPDRYELYNTEYKRYVRIFPSFLHHAHEEDYEYPFFVNCGFSKDFLKAISRIDRYTNDHGEALARQVELIVNVQLMLENFADGKYLLVNMFSNYPCDVDFGLIDLAKAICMRDSMQSAYKPTSYNCGHPTETGHRQIADALYKHLTSRI